MADIGNTHSVVGPPKLPQGPGIGAAEEGGEDHVLWLGYLTSAAKLTLDELDAGAGKVVERAAAGKAGRAAVEAGKGLVPRLLPVLTHPATLILGGGAIIAAADIKAQLYLERQRYLSAAQGAMARFNLPKTPDGLSAAKAYAHATEKFRSLEPKPNDETEWMRPYLVQGYDSINAMSDFWDGKVVDGTAQRMMRWVQDPDHSENRQAFDAMLAGDPAAAKKVAAAFDDALRAELPRDQFPAWLTRAAEDGKAAGPEPGINHEGDPVPEGVKPIVTPKPAHPPYNPDDPDEVEIINSGRSFDEQVFALDDLRNRKGTGREVASGNATGTRPPGHGPVDTQAADRADLRKQLEIKNAKAVAKGEPAPYPDLDAAVEERLAGWRQVSEQGFPFGFKDKVAFEAFKQRIVHELNARGVPNGDIGVHGSAVNKADPKDIDVAIRVDEAQFRELVQQALVVRPGSAAKINSQAGKGIMISYFLPPVNGVTFPQAIYGAAGERTLQVSFILKGGSFDIGPYLKF